MYINQPQANQNLYNQMLKSTGSLSNLFSQNPAPFLVSRNVENAFCQAFGAENLGRADCSADAKFDDIGIGIKTFLHGNGKTLQKIAEFNKDSESYRSFSSKELVLEIAKLRNERIRFTKDTYGLRTMVYHCVTRKVGKILIYEIPMDIIDITSISNVEVKNNRNTITFNDASNEYSFNVTKSTLYKRFDLNKMEPLQETEVNVLENPYEVLSDLFGFKLPTVISPASPVDSKQLEQLDFVILPLFSDRGGRRHVPEKSGLNQWNAAGRKRNPNEVYIPIPSWIHKDCEGFFPPRDIDFTLALPDNSQISAKVCQDNSKALMSNPNKKLGEWLLRQVMNLEEKELLTYEHLEGLGIDSVIVYKHGDCHYSIDFREVGTYDDFENENRG
ncbi:restriction endonuclease PLD domain-containing protein [Rossellomorea marisflavi]|uniref:restriction endonuclease PLD domain-containing protein n=1 Tax=Rossellomorea marisflavi TaxID=189381 RepID=UPI00064E9FB2|nr:restriction endonuclease PLD domain-containing protein [Rossellomorea marisflavi]KMK95063.1 hypothetical protein VL03_09845 [Rossellomorea marisflavi]